MNDQSSPGQRRSLTARQEFLESWKIGRNGEGAQPHDLGIYPYPGLRSFRPNEADLFYGRDSQIKELRDLLADHNIIVVLGGSGSGKSSLVRAGLVPKLSSTSPIAERPGAWYVVEFRPKLDPVNELFDAIFNQIILPVLTVEPVAGAVASDGVRGRDPVKERARRISAVNVAFNLECELDASNESIQWQCRTRLRDMLFEGDVIDVGALFDFVDEGLQMLDEALSDGASSGAPNLLLLIDQFEEVFKPKVGAAGSKMIMSLITSIHTYRPANLFLIITMRSEELHRCSEFIGVTEVVNSAMYLVDLIGGRDIEQAIVEPARRVLKSWDLDTGDPETGPYTRRALSRLHQVFDDGREALPHPADQLPLMQHLLPLVWDKAIQRWEQKTGETIFQIDLEDFEALPGWGSPEGPLIGTLNERANDVLHRAVLSGSRMGGGELSNEAVERLLRAAFCCLAQLDDRGNVVRDFATLEQMLMASGVYQRQPERQSACKGALKSALGVFQRATLVNVGTNYDVNHEALIRGWKTYANWLKDARRRTDRLVTVDHIIGDSSEPEQIGALARLWMKLTPLSGDVERCVRANQIAGIETSADLQDVLGPNGAFSDYWARQTLERSDAASPNPQVGTRSLDQRLSAVRQTVRDAIRYPEVKTKQLNRRGLFAVLGVLLLAGLGLLGWQNLSQRLQNIVQEDLNEQFRFFRLQSEATVVPANGARSAANDRELFAALDLALNRAKQQGKKPNVDEASAIFRTSLRQLELGARNVLAGVSVLRNLPSSHPDLSAVQEGSAHCTVADADQSNKFLIGKEPGRLGIELRPQEAGAVKATTMFPIWRTPDDNIAPIDSSNFAGQPLPSGALACLSDNANWLLVWPLQSDRHQGGADAGVQPPTIQRIVWIRTGPAADQDSKWHAELAAPRNPGTSQSYDDLVEGDDALNREYSRLYEAVHQRRQVFQFFRKDDNVGFLIDMAPERTAMLWTTTGLLDPDMIEFPLKDKLVDCQFSPYSRPDEKGETTSFRGCVMGPIFFDGLNHKLVADYKINEAPQLASAPPTSSLSCMPEGALCRTELRIEYDPPDVERGSQRVAFSHLSSTIKAAAIWDDALWVRDANGQVWRYLVGLEAIQALLPHRWKGVGEFDLAKSVYSPACKEVKCDRVLIPDWP